MLEEWLQNIRSEYIAKEQENQSLRDIIAEKDRQLSRPRSSFKLFDATNFRDKPDLSKYGLKRLRFINESQFWPNGGLIGPDLEYIEKNLLPKLAGEKEVVLDIERWDLRDDPTLQRHHLAVLSVFRRVYPRMRVGFYGEVPIRDYLHVGGDPKKRATRTTNWRNDNDEIWPLADAVDALYPSCYLTLGDTKVTDAGLRRAYIESMITESRRLAPRKPVYPVFWIAWGANHNDTIDGAVWREMLEQVHGLADGAVIWSMARDSPPLNLAAPWFVETVRFAEERGISV